MKPETPFINFTFPSPADKARLQALHDAVMINQPELARLQEVAREEVLRRLAPVIGLIEAVNQKPRPPYTLGIEAMVDWDDVTVLYQSEDTLSAKQQVIWRHNLEPGSDQSTTAALVEWYERSRTGATPLIIPRRWVQAGPFDATQRSTYFKRVQGARFGVPNFTYINKESAGYLKNDLTPVSHDDPGISPLLRIPEEGIVKMHQFAFECTDVLRRVDY